LPCTPDGRLLFARSTDPNEFWIALLEKAFAKLNKCYANLEYGSAASTLVDLSGIFLH